MALRMSDTSRITTMDRTWHELTSLGNAARTTGVRAVPVVKYPQSLCAPRRNYRLIDTRARDFPGQRENERKRGRVSE